MFLPNQHLSNRRIKNTINSPRNAFFGCLKYSKERSDVTSTKEALILPPGQKRFRYSETEVVSLLFSKGKNMDVKTASSVVFNVVIPRMCLVFFLVISSNIKERRELLLESQISIIVLFFNILMLDCYTCLRVCNFYCVFPKPGVKLLLTRIHVTSVLPGACAILLYFWNGWKTHFQLSRVVENLISELISTFQTKVKNTQ